MYTHLQVYSVFTLVLTPDLFICTEGKGSYKATEFRYSHTNSFLSSHSQLYLHHTMPTVAPSLVEVAFRASDFSVVAWKALESVPVDASVILPTFNKCLELDRAGQSPLHHLWIAIYSRSGTVALVLSCTEGYMGAYPVFIVNTSPINDNDLASCMHLAALTLQRHVPIDRVYSVFGPIKITQLFSGMWTQITGVQAEVQPYYDSKISCLRRHESQQPVTPSESSRFQVGPATQADILPIAKSCYAFAKDSVSHRLPSVSYSRAKHLLTAPFCVDRGGCLDRGQKTCIQ
jgi:hypothetical protein